MSTFLAGLLSAVFLAAVTWFGLAQIDMQYRPIGPTDTAQSRTVQQ